MRGQINSQLIDNFPWLTTHPATILFLMAKRKDVTSCLAHNKTAGTWGTLVDFHHQWAQAFQEKASCTEPVLETGSLESHTIGLEDPVSSKEYSRPAYIERN